MAKKKDQNEDPEEEKKNQFDDDDDFGLPDLDYDELGDDSDSDDDLDMDAFMEDELQNDEANEEILEEKALVIKAEEESKDVEEDLLPDNEEWEKELEAELDDDLKSGKFDEEEEVEAFYQEETFDEFESTVVKEEPSAASDSVFVGDYVEPSVSSAEDDFYTAPVEEKTFVAPAQSYQPQYSQYLEKDEGNKSKLTKTVVIGVILFVLVGSVLLYIFNSTSDKKQVAKVEKPKVVAPAPVVKPEPVPVEEVKPIDKAPKKAKASTVASGEIIRMEQRTGKSYVIIASFFDDDMAMDYANKLSADGKSPYIIPPFKDYRFYRVAIAEYDTFSGAVENLEAFKQEYATEVWPLKY